MIAAGEGPDGVGKGSPPGEPPEVLEWDDEEIATSPGTPNPIQAEVDGYSLVHTDRAEPIAHHPESFPSSYERNLNHAVARLVGTPSGHEISIQGITDLRSQNGANAYISIESGKPPRIAGYIYDMIWLLYRILAHFDGTIERSSRYYSPATIVRDLELTEAQSGEFTNASETVTARWSRVFDTAFYQIELRISHPQSEASLKPFLDGFAALQTFEIMSTTQSPVSLTGIRERFGHLLTIAKADNILQMLGFGDPNHDDSINFGVRRGSGLFVRDVDVGIGIKDRSVASVLLAFNQGDAGGESRTINSFNVSTWVGTPLADGRGIRWAITDTDYEAKNADWNDSGSLPLRRLVRDMWKNGLVHVNVAMEGVPIDHSGGGAGTPPVTGGSAPQGKIGGFSQSGENTGGGLSGAALRAPVQGASMISLNPGFLNLSGFNPMIAGAMGAAGLGGAAAPSILRVAVFL